MRRFVLYSALGFVPALALGLTAQGMPGSKKLPAKAQSSSGPDFSLEVRPILSQHCFKCHGPDDKQRTAGLRLDKRESAVGLLPSGRRAVLPGKPQESVLIKRILSHGADVMPPAYANKPLSDKEKEVLRRWVASGAVYKPHWAFISPKPLGQITLPRVSPQNAKWVRNPIDRFILARLEKEGLKPAPEADRYTLIRRVSLDLTGLPPTPEETDAFLTDKSPNAYEKLVDRLLASPAYGERWARRWLDLARYADTNGYEKDRFRSVWPYRDWVIHALNADMPFDQFTIEQIAGDLLPHATLDQKIATGFHRNTMLNEEGGIDPLEYRYYSMVDRTATTGTTWLGLTVGCAQCHTHKFDPITHRDYYRLMAFLDNTEENTIDVTKADIEAKRNEIEARAREREKNLAQVFPPDNEIHWQSTSALEVTTVSGAKATLQSDGSALLSGNDPDTDTYTVALNSDATNVGAVRLEVLTDPTLGSTGPGRTPHGNFVLTEFSATVTPKDGKPIPVKFVRAEADFSQSGFPPQNALDGDAKTGWAINGTGKWNVNRMATFHLDKPVHIPAGSRWTFRLDQAYGGHHTIGKFRLSLGQVKDDPRPLELRSRENLDRKFGEWVKQQEARAVRWEALRPTKAVSNLPLLNLLDDKSVFVTGDMTKRDVYDLDFQNVGKPITAIRLEAMPDDRLPKRGPGRVYYEGGFGDFFLSEISLKAGGKAVKFASASQSGGSAAQGAIDTEPQTGWSINGRQGETTIAVFRPAEPIAASNFSVRLVFEQYYAAALGRFRISVTSATRAATADLPADIEESLLLPASQRTSTQNAALLQQFLSVSPDLQSEREAIAQMRRQMPAYPTAFVFAERPANNPRVTYIHHRGEFLQTEEKVTPGVPAVLPAPPVREPANRLTFARWLVSPTNPLTARVAVNRQWAAFFGKGIVRSTDDFGYQGQPPTHPELLDWLAATFMSPESRVESREKGAPALSTRSGLSWSMKKLHRLIVTSATYRQSSNMSPSLLAKDPENKLLARGPRIRLDAELLRDQALTASGLLSHKIGGPSVFPPQPPGVSSEGAYGPLDWKVSEGEDRYRRGLYTFSKRTAPYAMFTTFDAPSGEVCVARREVSNTPLQALTMLNDQVYVETAQALGRTMAARQGGVSERVAYLFRRCATRPPTSDEARLLAQFYTTQRTRFEKKELDAAMVAGKGDGDVNDRAAWTVLARAILNLDEVITRR